MWAALGNVLRPSKHTWDGDLDSCLEMMQQKSFVERNAVSQDC